MQAFVPEGLHDLLIPFVLRMTLAGIQVEVGAQSRTKGVELVVHQDLVVEAPGAQRGTDQRREADREPGRAVLRRLARRVPHATDTLRACREHRQQAAAAAQRASSSARR